MQTVLVANRKGGVGKTMISVTLASAFAVRGHRVALADADRQQSALGWLAMRPADAAPIGGLDWSRAADIGEHPKKLDWLVIDAPGALKGAKAEALIAEARAVLVPVQPSAFDIASTRAFLAELDELKRVRKGKVQLHIVVNRARAGSRLPPSLEAFFAEIESPPVHMIAERAIYGQLAAQGLSIFDRRQKLLDLVKEQWASLLDVLGADAQRS